MGSRRKQSTKRTQTHKASISSNRSISHTKRLITQSPGFSIQLFPIIILTNSFNTQRLGRKRGGKIVMSTLGDDELSLILNRINDSNDRNSFSLVCKRWLRVEGQTRLSIRVIELDSFQSFLPKFPNLCSFESTRFLSNAHLQFVVKT